MSHYPTTFAETTQELPADLGDRGNAARERLAEKGFKVVAGLTRAVASEVRVIANQRAIREFCPKEPTEKRFGSPESTEQWLGKEDKKLGERGRGMFLLVRELGGDALQLAGYGWTGPEFSEEVEGGTSTFAIRIREEATGQGLAAPFTQMIVDGSATMYDASNFWLETWKSNHAAGVYRKVGFVTVAERTNELRPTLEEEGSIMPDGQIVIDGKVVDTRLYMSYPNELLPTAA